MKNLNRYTVLPILLFALIYVVGCGPTTISPKGWLPSASAAQHESYGGWVSVRYHTGDSESEVRGELIAIHSNQVLILNSDMLISIPVDSISDMKLTIYNADSKNIGVWTAVGTLSTLSHGVCLVLSAPTWIIGGLNATASTYSQAEMIYPAKPLDAFRAYARFPQGLSKAIDMQFLQLKKKDVKVSVPTELLESLQKDQSTPLGDLAQQNAVIAEAIAAAEEDADTYADTIIGTLFAKEEYEPSLPPGRLLGKSPTYVAFYAAAYSAKAKSLYVKNVWTGSTVCCVVTLGGCLLMSTID